MPDDAQELTFCCLLWSQPDRTEALHGYEDAVLALFGDHGAVVLERVFGDGADDQPVEVQLLRFPRQAALDAYMIDPPRTALLGERDRVVARTVLFPISRPGPERSRVASRS